MSWDKITLGSIAEFRNGINFDKSSFGKGIKVINVSAFKDRLIPHYDSLPEINPDGIIKKDDILHNSDILFVRSNGNKELVGRSMFIDDIQEQITFSGFCIRCRFKTKDIYPLFYAYLFKGQLIRSELSNSSNGTNITNLNQTLLNNLGVPKPPLETQKRIASILSAYDDLIENNLKRIKLLEETAQNIYKEWFVNFRFPNYEHTEFDAESGLPNGWKMEKVGQLVSFKGGYPFKSSEYTDNGKFRIVTIKNVGDRFFDGSNTSGIENIPDKMKDYCKLKEGDILMSLTGNIGRTCLVYGDNYVLNQRVVLIEPVNFENKAFCYFLFNTDSIKGLMNNLASGVAQQNLSPVKLEEQIILLPPSNLMLQYSSSINGMISQIILLNKQNQNLKEARDIMLPRLMNRTIEA